MLNETITYVLNLAIVAIVGYGVRYLVKTIPPIINFIVSKVGINNYTKLKSVAQDIWNGVEEDGRLGKLVNDKAKEFENRIKTMMPSVTDDEINTVRQAIAGEVNKDKPVVEKAVEQSETVVQQVQITPVIKYIAPDGTELQPVAATVQATSDTTPQPAQPNTQQVSQ